MKSSLIHHVKHPDSKRLEFFRNHPQLGPKILFFSGGSALKETSEELVHFTHNSIHVMTAMDSGGSSAKLRKAFEMPAIGDLRKRLLALADLSWSGNPAVLQLLSYRLSKQAERRLLQDEIECLKTGSHPLIQAVSEPMRTIIRNFLNHFLEKMPKDFDLRGASIGNLILTSGYLHQRRQLDPVIYLFSQMVHCRGIVRPVTEQCLHLAAELENGDIIVGQHRLTGKEFPPIEHPIRRIFLTRSLKDETPLKIPVTEKIVDLISEAELICYPMGSFYSSLLTNLLPAGTGEAIRANPCPKVFIPNTVHDSEIKGKSLSDLIEILLFYLKKDAPTGISDREVLNLVLLDETYKNYHGPLNREQLKQRGIEVIDRPLISARSHPLIEGKLLVPILLSLV